MSDAAAGAPDEAWRGVAGALRAGCAGGAAAALLACAVELAVRAAAPGGAAAGELWRASGWAAGVQAAAGGGLGLLAGAALAALPPLGRAPSRVARAALATLALGGSVLVALALRESLGVSLRSPGGWLLAALVPVAGTLAVVAHRPLERALAALLASRPGALVFGASIVSVLAVELPHVLLREAVLAVSDPVARGAAALVGLVAAGVCGVPLLAHGVGATRRPGGLRRATLGYAALAALAVGVAAWPRPAHEAAPNLLLLTIDTLRRDHLSTYGYARPTAPNLDRLAAEGTLFLDAVSVAPFTMPSTATLLTGRFPHQHGVRHHPSEFPPEEVTIAEVLRDAGYATGAVVSNPLLSRRWGFDQGFDFFDGNEDPPLGALAELTLPRQLGAFRRPSRAGPTADAALGWLRRHHREPFALWVHFIDPHFPYDAPAEVTASFAAPADGAFAELLADLGEGRRTLGDVNVSRLPAELLQAGAARYDAEIAYTDRELGRILEALDELGLRRETLIAVTSDHGEGLGEHGLTFEHSDNTFEELMRIPLLLVWPDRVPAGRAVPEQVSLLDVAPTLLDLLGRPVPDGVAGRSLRPLLEGAAADWTVGAAFGENAPLLPGHPTYATVARYGRTFLPGIEGKWRMVRAPPWKLIRVPGRPEGDHLLFHLGEDPGELHDRAGEEPERVAELETLLERHLLGDRADAAPLAPIGPEELEQLRALGYAE